MKHVISVACLAKYNKDNNDVQLCKKSNYGKKYVDLAAPGELIPCPIPNNLADMPVVKGLHKQQRSLPEQ